MGVGVHGGNQGIINRCTRWIGITSDSVDTAEDIAFKNLVLGVFPSCIIAIGTDNTGCHVRGGYKHEKVKTVLSSMGGCCIKHHGQPRIHASTNCIIASPQGLHTGGCIKHKDNICSVGYLNDFNNFFSTHSLDGF